MATYNGAQYIKQQVESIICQLSSNDEIIVSDDGSTDDTILILSSFNDPRIKIYNNIKKSHLSNIAATVTANFENAIKHAQGDIIFLSDQDDVWVPNKVEVLKKYLDEYDLVISDAYVTDSNLNIIHSTRFYKGCGQTQNILKAFVTTTPYQGSCMAFRRKILSKAFPFPQGLRSHDIWLGFISAVYFKVRIVPEKLIYYRRHDHVVSTTGEKSPNPLFTKIIHRLKFWWLLMSRVWYHNDMY